MIAIMLSCVKRNFQFGGTNEKTIRNILIVVALLSLVLGLGMCYWKGWDYFILDLTFGSPQDHDAYAGNLVIPSVGIDLPCLEMIINDYELAEQAIDKTCCGAKMWIPFSGNEEEHDPSNENGFWLFGDHDFQGFDAIMGCNEGDIVYFDYIDGTHETYIVAHTHEGAVLGGTCLDKGGNQFVILEDMDAVLMTCYPDGDLPYEKKDRRFFVCLELIEE